MIKFHTSIFILKKRCETFFVILLVQFANEKLIQFIKNSGVDVSKLSPKTIETFAARINKLPTRDAAMNLIRDTIRQMMQVQGKYNYTGEIA